MVTLEELQKLSEIYDLHIVITCAQIGPQNLPDFSQGYMVSVGLKPDKYKMFPSWIDAIFISAHYNEYPYKRDYINVLNEIKENNYGELYFCSGNLDLVGNITYEDLERVVINVTKLIKEYMINHKLKRIDDDFIG